MEQLTPELLEKVKEKAADGHISCRAALSLARELNVSPPQIGQAANELGVKIFGCQLGCFR